jgi:hypothetical protein
MRNFGYGRTEDRSRRSKTVSGLPATTSINNERLHSYQSAIDGSTCEARYAGSRHTAAPIKTLHPTTRKKVKGSEVETPYT